MPPCAVTVHPLRSMSGLPVMGASGAFAGAVFVRRGFVVVAVIIDVVHGAQPSVGPAEIRYRAGRGLRLAAAIVEVLRLNDECAGHGALREDRRNEVGEGEKDEWQNGKTQRSKAKHSQKARQTADEDAGRRECAHTP